MTREIGWEQIQRDASSVVTVGTFDGVHRGHQAILSFLCERAKALQGTPTVLTFDPHPRAVVRNADVPLLTTIEERARALEHLGIARMVVLPFTQELAQYDPEAYVREVLWETIGLQAIAVGYDHRFGRNRGGDVSLLRAMGADLGFTVEEIPPQAEDDEVISSTRIRKQITEEGAVADAAQLLGRRYTLSGTVERGDQRGRTIGFPTANIRLNDARSCVPRHGVYATRVHGSALHEPHVGMCNIGVRPTFDGTTPTIEVHMLDFEGNLYDETLCVEFVQRLRGEVRFDSVDALKAQLSEDRTHCIRVMEAASTPSTTESGCL
ncbi:MAG: bifunctional riboflavin kinase/FAD synthetase [Longimonas sp.]|uniref:bifunctional riboflavin kinase/FAD synthetase n=1 Tax=Longimonas sp. TaxID=2039626 RepID=UPI00397621AB